MPDEEAPSESEEVLKSAVTTVCSRVRLLEFTFVFQFLITRNFLQVTVYEMKVLYPV